MSISLALMFIGGYSVAGGAFWAFNQHADQPPTSSIVAGAVATLLWILWSWVALTQPVGWFLRIATAIVWYWAIKLLAEDGPGAMAAFLILVWVMVIAYFFTEGETRRR